MILVTIVALSFMMVTKNNISQWTFESRDLFIPIELEATNIVSLLASFSELSMDCIHFLPASDHADILWMVTTLLRYIGNEPPRL